MAVHNIIDDCEWAVEKAKEHLKQNDKHGARAWMMTAQSLFPYRFIVQVGLLIKVINSYNKITCI